MDDLRVVNGRVWTGEALEEVAVGMKDGLITTVGREAPAHETIDAGGKWVLPGLIDTQVHFREPGLTHKETIGTGSAAAVAGGVTTYFEMPNTVPNTLEASHLQEKLRIAAATSHANFAFFVGAARENLHQLESLETLSGCAGVKIFMGSSTGSLLLDDEDDLSRALRNGRRRVACHCEDEARNREMRAQLPEGADVSWHPRIRDAESARLAVERLVRAGEAAGRPVHVLHVSAAEEVTLLRNAKARGADVTCEVTPQHLWFSSDDYEHLGTRIQQNPPIRDRGHRLTLRSALRAGVFDVFGSDHAPHTLEEKARAYPSSPSGMPGAQTSLRVLLALGASPQMIAGMFAEAPARIFEIMQKGALKEGYDADLIVVEPEIRRPLGSRELFSKCGWSPFEGEELPVGPTHTIVGGRVAFAEGALRGEPSGAMVRFAVA